jgi:hypothetical protein
MKIENDELKLNIDKQRSDLKRAIGQILKTEDGSMVLVNTIVHSKAYTNKAVINENPNNGGYFIHLLSLFAQLNGETLDEEDMKLFDSLNESTSIEKEPVADIMDQIKSTIKNFKKGKNV